MLIETNASVALFLFAHQDDEFGVFAQIEQELRLGRRVQCVYVTDGAATACPDVRDAESRLVLEKLGVHAADIIFVGRHLRIRDGELHLNVKAFEDWLNDFINLNEMLAVCFVPAWEGGHPDHDLVHAIAVKLFSKREWINRVWQYSLYHGRSCSGPFFRTLSPLPENGLVTRWSIPWRDRLRYVRLCLSYPSQWRTWIGLFPFACAHYVWSGVQNLQHVDNNRILQPPHVRPLYYERRGFLDWPTLSSAVEQLIEEKSVNLTAADIPTTSKKD
ncbi:PIG-L family deacetylase [uncultured Herbaspirillum sp.]|uniref:PIG-L deacetylase family protein n=1 Tax=uncultured Herbaspirillum sp. TaxID=160236 RepID=UPI000A037B2B|nr:PIG-L family deacetylase [uncultured Herbaspirillum sp.]